VYQLYTTYHLAVVPRTLFIKEFSLPFSMTLPGLDALQLPHTAYTLQPQNLHRCYGCQKPLSFVAELL